MKPSMVDRSKEVWEIRLEEDKTAHHGLDRTLFVGPPSSKSSSSVLTERFKCILF